jgi:hypothetical protein
MMRSSEVTLYLVDEKASKRNQVNLREWPKPDGNSEPKADRNQETADGRWEGRAQVKPAAGSRGISTANLMTRLLTHMREVSRKCFVAL